MLTPITPLKSVCAIYPMDRRRKLRLSGKSDSVPKAIVWLARTAAQGPRLHNQM